MLSAVRKRLPTNRQVFLGVTGCLAIFYITYCVHGSLGGYPAMSSVFQDSEFRYFPGQKQVAWETSSNSTCSGRYDVAYVFNRKTGSTTLVTLLNRVGRKYGFPMKREISLHNSNDFGGLLNMYHLGGVDYNSHLETGARAGAQKRRNVLLPSHDRKLRIVQGFVGSHQVTIDTIFVSIARDPAANFRSAFDFFDISQKYFNGQQSDFEMFLSNPQYYREKMPNGSLAWAVTRNSQLWHFGLDHSYHDNTEVVDQYIDRISEEIDLVLLNEYYDESLVLLKKLLCWNMEDILYIARRVSHSPRSNLSAETRHKIYRWNSADVRLYDKFKQLLWEKIEEYGESFQRDLQLFKTLKNLVTDDCDGLHALSLDTMEYLSRHGTYIKDGRQYCKHVEAWFSFDVDVQYEIMGPREYKVSPTSSKAYLKTQHSQKPKMEYQGVSCLKINYHKYSGWFGWPERSLDVYLRIGGDDDWQYRSSDSQRGEYTAMTEVNTSRNSLQVMSEGGYSGEEYIISAVSVSPGSCDL